MSENFMRRYVLKAGIEGKHGLEIGHTESATQDALHVSFSVEKSESETSNEGKIQIWNLSDASLKILEQKDCVVELRAGYGDSMALILVGEVRDVITTMDGADRLTEITVVDGMKSTTETDITIALKGKVNTKDLYEMIAAEMGLAIRYGAGVEFKTIPYGFGFAGMAQSALKKVASYNGHQWTIQNEIIQIYVGNKGVHNVGYVLSKETGLISVPKRIKTKEDYEETGWEVQYFLNGAIGVNDIVNLKTKVANGYFRVAKVTITGDNLSGEWICKAEIKESVE